MINPFKITANNNPKNVLFIPVFYNKILLSSIIFLLAKSIIYKNVFYVIIIYAEFKKMKKEIGIPRAISYYNYYPFYFGFFKELGIKVILSDKTTSALINAGSRFVAAETCLPVKTFVGHVINLLNKGVTNILVPSFQSTGFKINNCSKIRGLPEIIRNVIDKPFRMIEPTYDMTEKIDKFDFCKYIANEFEIFDVKLIKSAIEAGDEVQSNFEKIV